ncbi:MAG TPA: cytochrome c biogenesis protein ResB [Blastocatellia bacterium]|nr:cytochrome c biogenesis protein ResB [Blastocatellia bacterium]
MATKETEVRVEAQSPTVAAPVVKVKSKKDESILDKVLGLLSSVRFGIVMLSILLICCMIGMLIMQVEVEGFQEYYDKLTPAQRLIYGSLGFFNIYHSWYFSLLLAITGLNIILASIDRFPTAWQYYARPKLTASPKFIKAQMFHTEAQMAAEPQAAAEAIRAAWKKRGFRAKITEENGRLTVFAQKNLWNRYGAYVVHVALLTIFVGGFLTNRYGVGGMMEIRPGATTNMFRTLEYSVEGQRVGQAFVPFQVECTDLQQKLIREEGGLDANNTIDWLSYIKIKDEGVEIPALVHLNNPFDYRGYRFFQSQFTPVGNAREITVSFEPVNGGPARQVKIPRDGTVEVEGIGRVTYEGFFPDFDISEGKPVTITGEYNNPVAQISIIGPDGKGRRAFAFNPRIADEFYKGGEAQKAEGEENAFLVNGNRVVLKDFEKVALAHTLTVQYDPGRLPVYVGFTLLSLALCGVFFFAHQRVWAVVEPDGRGSKVHFGGNTNRNRPAFEGRFNSLVQSVTGGGNREE